MNEPANQTDQTIPDEGLDKGLASLAEDRIEKTILQIGRAHV